MTTVLILGGLGKLISPPSSVHTLFFHHPLDARTLRHESAPF
jgi:hypothetical protein